MSKQNKETKKKSKIDITTPPKDFRISEDYILQYLEVHATDDDLKYFHNLIYNEGGAIEKKLKDDTMKMVFSNDFKREFMKKYFPKEYENIINKNRKKNLDEKWSALMKKRNIDENI